MPVLSRFPFLLPFVAFLVGEISDLPKNLKDVLPKGIYSGRNSNRPPEGLSAEAMEIPSTPGKWDLHEVPSQVMIALDPQFGWESNGSTTPYWGIYNIPQAINFAALKST